MYKFFINENQKNDNKINIIGQDVNHIKNVLRIQKDEKIQICIKETRREFCL